MVAKYSAKESAGDTPDGVEILKNEPYEDEKRKGQYTHKIYHLATYYCDSKVLETAFVV